jgi:hypothetical protein
MSNFPVVSWSISLQHSLALTRPFLPTAAQHVPHLDLRRHPDRRLGMVSRQLLPHGIYWIALRGQLWNAAGYFLDDWIKRFEVPPQSLSFPQLRGKSQLVRAHLDVSRWARQKL